MEFDMGETYDDYDVDMMYRQFSPDEQIGYLGHTGTFNTSSKSSRQKCTLSKTHFECPDGDCLPVYLRCNGIPDCYQGE